MKINPALYETLSPRQRIIATIEAEARGDQAEVQRLVKTCPRKTYSQADAAYTDTMNALQSLCMMIQIELLQHALGFWCAVQQDHAASAVLLQRMADIQAAWAEVIKPMGLDPSYVEKAFLPPSTPILEIFLDFLPEPNPENVTPYREVMSGCLR